MMFHIRHGMVFMQNEELPTKSEVSMDRILLGDFARLLPPFILGAGRKGTP